MNPLSVIRGRSAAAPPPRSAERERLADAIAAATAARDAVVSQRAAIDSVRGMEADARAKHAAAVALAGAAREAQTDAVVRAASNGHHPPESAALRETHLAVVVALDDAESMKAAMAQLEGALPALEAATQSADQARDAAANDVIRASEAVRALFREARAVQARLIELRGQLAFLQRERLIGGEDTHAVRGLLNNADELPCGSWSNFGAYQGHKPDWTKRDIPPAWRATFEALLTDPDAPLPA